MTEPITRAPRSLLLVWLGCDVAALLPATARGWKPASTPLKRSAAPRRSATALSEVPSIGFDAAPPPPLVQQRSARAQQWERNFQLLAAFRDREAHCDVPQKKHEEQGAKPGTWLNNQRTTHGKGMLHAARRARLEALGVAWGAQEQYWDRRFEVLMAFRDREAHCQCFGFFASNAGFQILLLLRDDSPPLREARHISLGRKPRSAFFTPILASAYFTRSLRVFFF